MLSGSCLSLSVLLSQKSSFQCLLGPLTQTGPDSLHGSCDRLLSSAVFATQAKRHTACGPAFLDRHCSAESSVYLAAQDTTQLLLEAAFKERRISLTSPSLRCCK